MTTQPWIRIGDLARELDVTHRTLHWWESEFANRGQVRRMAGGTRLYTPEVAALFREVWRLLRVELYTTAGAKRQLRLAAERQKTTVVRELPKCGYCDGSEQRACCPLVAESYRRVGKSSPDSA